MISVSRCTTHLSSPDRMAEVTFSCLINAALELNVPDRTPPLLAKFSEVPFGILPEGAPTSHCHMLDFPDPLPETGEHCTEGPVCTLQAVWSGVGKAQACSLLGHTFRFGLWPMQKPCRIDLLEAYAKYTDILVTMRCSTQRQVEMNNECFYAKDYVLHFRCYVALGNVKDAEKLFQQLDTKADVQGPGPMIRVY